MELAHLPLNQLKISPANVRRKGAKDIDDLLPSVRSLGIIQPLVVRPNCDGHEIIAGQRRYYALVKLAEDNPPDPVPCIIMQDGDDAKAIEASLAENIARLPMDEIDQYKAFCALEKRGRSVGDIAAHFGITERLVTQRLAIGNLIGPILTAYSKEEINAQTVRVLTMATKKQQKAWLELFKAEDQHAPQGARLKEWLFGGKDISVDAALFDVAEYTGAIVSDLFGEDRYFDDATSFWSLQSNAVSQAKVRYEQNGWAEVVIMEIGDYFRSYEHVKTAKKDGGRVYIEIRANGEVSFHEGFITNKEAKRREKAASGEKDSPAPRCELTKAMQNYLDLHRHAAVRSELLGNSGLALRVATAQIIAGSDLWCVHADPQKASTDAVQASLDTNLAQDTFAAERHAVRELLGVGTSGEKPLVHGKEDWSKSHEIGRIFAKLITLDDEAVMRVFAFVVAETLGAGSVLVEALGAVMKTDMRKYWSPDQTFFDLLRDKEAINGIVRQVGGKGVADANVAATAKVQKQVISAYLDGTRKPRCKDWKPLYMDFPMNGYTKRGGIEAAERSKLFERHMRAVRKA